MNLPSFSPNSLFYHKERGGLTGSGGGIPRGKVARYNATQSGNSMLGFARDGGPRRSSDGGSHFAISEPQGRRWGSFDPHSYSISFLSSMHISQLQQHSLNSNAGTGNTASGTQDVASFALLNMSLSGLGPRLDVTEVEVLEDQHEIAQEKYKVQQVMQTITGSASGLVNTVDNGLSPTFVESNSGHTSYLSRNNPRL